MQVPVIQRWRTWLSLVLLLAVGLGGCEVDLQALYQAAIQDAAVAEESEISRNLVAIVPENQELVWETGTDQPRVLMVTWTGWTGYDSLVGADTVLARDVWVTPAPAVQDWVREHQIGPANLTLRLEQLLGLPPDAGETRFVELWVSPDEMFRPSPDPEITDHEASLDFPAPVEFIGVSSEYRTWFANQQANSYGPNGYPWTRLGYTYDWGNCFNEIGLSEFVIPAGKTVGVKSVTLTEEYCRWW